MKKLITEYKKETIVIAILLVILISLIGIALIEPQNKKDTNIKENIDTETKEEIKNEENNNTQIETENPQPEEPPNVDNSNNREEIENPNSNEDNIPQTDNNTSNSSTTNNKPSNNQSSNNQQSSSNNNQDQQNNNTTTTPENNETSNEPTIVTSNNINLGNYNTNIKITKPGTYTLSGNLNNTLYIDTTSEVTLNLNGVKIYSTEDAAITNINQNNLVINLQEGTTNILSDAGTETDYDACLYSNGHLIINGSGILRVVGNRVDDEGIATKNAPITINNGKITIVTKDDGINTGGDGGTISINGGTIYIDAGGDGIDSNRDVIINGGILYTTGSSIGNYSGLDADKGLLINGGTVVSTGSSYLQIPLSTSKQKSLSLGFDSYNNDNQIYSLADSNGNEVISFMAKEKFQSITISSNKITDGNYFLYSGGTHTGTLTNHIYEDGIYTKGELMSVNGESSFKIDINNSSYTDTSTNIMGLNKVTKIPKEIKKEKREINTSLIIAIICTCVLSFIAFILNKKIVRSRI